MQAGPTVQSFVGHATERQVGKSHDQRSMLIGSLLLNRKVEAQEELADTMTPTERILQWSRQKMAAWVTVMEMRSVERIRYIFWNINQQDLAKSVLWVMREEMLWLVPILQSRYSQPHQKFQTPITLHYYHPSSTHSPQNYVSGCPALSIFTVTALVQ